MILPITAYGHPVLREKSKEITRDYPDLEKLIADMWETLYGSHGVGLAAPQVNRPIRLFLVDSKQVLEQMDEDERAEYEGDEGVKQAFINAQVAELNGEPWSYEEGCLSIPKVREDVNRPETVTLHYLDEQFRPHEETFTGLTARVIQHEYDHIEGKLFIDYLKPLKKRLLKKRLGDISKGKVDVDYKMLFSK
jgi:peptide deformylase